LPWKTDFYSHWGVSPKSIARAIWVNTSGGKMPGRQYADATVGEELLPDQRAQPEPQAHRSHDGDAAGAALRQARNPRGYLNEVFVGQDGQRAVHGFGLASQFFFSQPLSELKLHQVALLVGMVKGPSYYNPRRNPERALERRNLVLDVLNSRAWPPPNRSMPRRRCRWA
jgi:penicillin-binding protein 1B